MVLALETGGRWSSEALAFVRLLARASARSEPQLMRKAGLAVPLVVSAHLAKTAFSQKTEFGQVIFVTAFGKPHLARISVPKY